MVVKRRVAQAALLDGFNGVARRGQVKVLEPLRELRNRRVQPRNRALEIGAALLRGFVLVHVLLYLHIDLNVSEPTMQGERKENCWTWQGEGASGSELRSASPFGMPLSRGELRRCGG
jgi:hypothetical protein